MQFAHNWAWPQLQKKVPIVTFSLPKFHISCYLFVIWLKLVLLADMSDKFKASAGQIPYGFLIDIYQKYNATPDQMLEVKTAYLGVYIGRTDRFCKTVRRIVAPTIPSILNGKVILSGDSLLRYRNKIWILKIWNKYAYNVINAVHKFIIIEILPKCSVFSWWWQ